jgi:uncharacterized protein (DUF1684 family)
MADQNLDVVRRQLEARRRQKDQWALNSPDSPLDEEQRTGIPGLDYYPVDFAYRVPARLEREDHPHTIQIQTTTGEWREYKRVGLLSFELNGQPLSLCVFQQSGDKAHTGRKALFLPFRDRTSGRETYGAGRYLDLAENRDDSDMYTLDFNEAYNPYCAYSPNWSCTIPPRENHLPVEIRAGEKNLPGHDDSH